MISAECRATFVSLLESELKQQQVEPVVREYRAGEVIFEEGDPGDGLYAILNGLVRISAFVSQSNKHALREFAAGDFFGEMAIINNASRSATATAQQDSRLLFVSRDQVTDLMEQSPQLVFALLHAFSLRMRETNSHFVHEMLEAERLSLMGRFARSIVHDLKNPLSVIALAADATASERASPELRAQAKKRIHQQVQRLTHMLNELLRVSEGSTQHALEPVNFATYFAEVIDQTRDELENKKVVVEVQAAAPDIVLPLNTRRLDHVFFNLFNNAADFMPDGGRIMVRFEQNPREIYAEVEDTGPGFKPGIVDKLFTPFFTDGKPTGTGLGLSICKNIVEDHGGRIWPKEVAGCGGVFCFTLPLKA
ncbi:ATP-binding protein [Prosthecobacter sp.]|uniref:ATP-binding protein n=1 Tax=Prosthecobacter sp. TaxID=1965333 RepID=UPI001DCB3D48|nr:ATP-binding protein [Prosthecobacter sp.]MCB1277607.1 cyclic nucleotide-binding domain-containing protein [Prosthecobacter sp.]